MQSPSSTSLANLSVDRMLLSLLYGGVTASTYIALRVSSPGGGLPIFALAALLVFIVHLALWPHATLKGFTHKTTLLRGGLFALAQLCLLQGQASSTTASTFVAAIAGAVTAAVGGHALLDERIEVREAAAAAICLLGLGLLAHQGNEEVNGWAILGGFLQGGAATGARALMREERSKQDTVAVGALLSAVLGLLSVAASGHWGTLHHLKLPSIVATAVAMTVIQYTFLHLIKTLDSQKANLLALLRVPWALVLEAAFLSVPLNGSRALASVLILAGAAGAATTLRQRGKPAPRR